MEDRFTSLKLSKKLAEAGCKLESEYGFYEYECSYQPKSIEIEEKNPMDGDNYHYKFIVDTYDILWDICCKYARDFFPKDKYTGRNLEHYHTCKILCLMRKGKKQEAEDYIWEHCLFNKANKKESEYKKLILRYKLIDPEYYIELKKILYEVPIDKLDKLKEKIDYEK